MPLQFDFEPQPYMNSGPQGSACAPCSETAQASELRTGVRYDFAALRCRKLAQKETAAVIHRVSLAHVWMILGQQVGRCRQVTIWRIWVHFFSVLVDGLVRHVAQTSRGPESIAQDALSSHGNPLEDGLRINHAWPCHRASVGQWQWVAKGNLPWNLGGFLRCQASFWTVFAGARKQNPTCLCLCVCLRFLFLFFFFGGGGWPR